MLKNKSIIELRGVSQFISFDEFQMACKHLSGFSKKEKEDFLSKMEDLFIKLRESKSNEEAIRIVKDSYPEYELTGDQTPHVLVNRTQDKVYESLLLEVNIYRSGVYPVWFRALTDVRKMLLITHLLKLRNQGTYIPSLLKYIITVSKKYQFYPELVEAMTFNLEYCIKNRGSDEYETYLREIRSYRRLGLVVDELIEDLHY